MENLRGIITTALKVQQDGPVRSIEWSLEGSAGGRGGEKETIVIPFHYYVTVDCGNAINKLISMLLRCPRMFESRSFRPNRFLHSSLSKIRSTQVDSEVSEIAVHRGADKQRRPVLRKRDASEYGATSSCTALSPLLSFLSPVNVYLLSKGPTLASTTESYNDLCSDARERH